MSLLSGSLRGLRAGRKYEVKVPTLKNRGLGTQVTSWFTPGQPVLLASSAWFRPSVDWAAAESGDQGHARN
jgi:hypothetical protein